MGLNRSRLNWGVFLVVLGAIPLAVEVGLIDRALTAQFVSLWPVVLIALGIGLMLRFGPAHALGGVLVAATFGVVVGALVAGGGTGVRGTCVGNSAAAGSQVTQNGEFPAGGGVDIELSCVELTVDRQAGSQWSVQAQHGNEQAPRIELDGNVLELSTFDGPFLNSARREWHVTLPQTEIGSMSLTTNAAQAVVNLGGGALRGFSGTFNASDARLDLSATEMAAGAGVSLTFNAASGTVLLPATAAGSRWSVTINASSLRLCANPQLALRIGYTNALSSDSFAEAGLQRVGDGWQTPSYDTATARLEMSLSATVSSTSLDRSGACQ